MSLSTPFITRPVGTSLLALGLALGGALAFSTLPVAPLPQVEYPTILVATTLPGASADTMAATVTTPLERQLGQMPGLAQMTSVSGAGSSQITLQFALSRSIDAAEQDVQAAINAASNLLPRGLPAPPTYSKSNPADAPVLTLALTGAPDALRRLADVADSILAQRLSQVSGVGLVTLGGAQKPAVRVQVDPDALAAAQLSIEDVRAALVAANVNQPKGSLDGLHQSYALATDDQLGEAAAFREVVLAYQNGAALRLRAVADVVDGVENAQLAAWADAQPAIVLNVQRQPGANIIAVADRIHALLPLLRAALPADAHLDVVADRTETVRASVADVEMTLALTIALVVAVIYLFLGNLRATLIPALAVPLSLLGTFAAMAALGFSLDNLSLMALTISTGFVVDDAIVMLENIARYIEAGRRPLDAALAGAAQMGFTIVSLTVSLVAVLIPLLLMGGVVGRLFREFAVTLSVAIGVSALLSLTLTPMMCAHVLRPHAGDAAHASIFERGFAAVLARYGVTLGWVMRHQRLTLVVTAATVLATAALAVAVPKGFFPTQDTGLVLAVAEARADISFEHMRTLTRRISAVMLADPDVAHVAAYAGVDGSNAAANAAHFSITLRPERGVGADSAAVARRLHARLAAVDGAAVYLQPAQDLQVDARLGATQYQYTLQDVDGAQLRRFAPRLLAALRARPELRDVASDQGIAGLAARLDIDRTSAGRLGVAIQAVDDVLYDAFGQRIVSTIFTQLNQYRVILEVQPQYRQDPAALAHLYVPGSAAGPVPLSSVVQMRIEPAPLTVSHQGQFDAITLSFNVAPGASLGAAVAAIETTMATLTPPPSVQASFVGSAAAFQDALAGELPLILAALVTVYIVLGVLYESFIHPVTILSTLPSAGLGALGALILCRTDFSMMALIGMILLIGIVKKNAIMMIDFALVAEREQGMAPLAAITEACMLRFRPIMMTTMAALLGGLPLALGHGAGSELRRPLGIAIVGGLLVSQVLTLYTTPVIYLAMHRLGARLRRRVLPAA